MKCVCDVGVSRVDDRSARGGKTETCSHFGSSGEGQVRINWKLRECSLGSRGWSGDADEWP